MPTPIKVRGKRISVKRERSKYSVDSLPNLKPHSKGKRPGSPPSHFSNYPAKIPLYTNTCSGNVVRPVRFAASLEQLPTELLETIFFCHLNLSLPQASPLIGRKLASKHVKTQLVLKVCSVGTLNTYPSEQANPFPAVADHAEAQSAILRMKWMKLTFIRQLIPDYITKTLVRELSERGLQWLGKGPPVTKATESTIRQYLRDNHVRLREADQSSPPLLSHVSWRIERPSRLIRVSFSLHDGIVIIEERHIRGYGKCRTSSSNRHQWRIFSGVNGCIIPMKLLHGPWTAAKCDFLEMVVRGNATVDWIGTTSGEIAEKGLMQALRENNVRATRLLVTRAGSNDRHGVWDIPGPPWGSKIRELDSGPWPYEGWCLAQNFKVRGVGVVPRTSHLRTAVLEAGCQQNIVETLLMADDADIDGDDRVLNDWCVEKSLRGDPRGPWLLRRLGGSVEEDACSALTHIR